MRERWRRWRRHMFTDPHRPVLFPDQVPLAVVTGAVLLGSIAFVIWVFVR